MFEIVERARERGEWENKYMNTTFPNIRYDWNPLTACQCLQQCKYDSIEAFDMASSCAYEDIEIRTASLFPDLVMIPGTDSEVVRETDIPS